MRYILISDVHGNLEALQAVMEFVRILEPYQFYCLGDVVGYGADPQACLHMLQEEASLVLAGNHDLAVAEVISTDGFNPIARESVEWTRRTLDEDDKESLANFPLVYVDGNYLFTHASPIEPMSFHYIQTLNDAADVLSSIGQQFCFVGHTHLPVLVMMEERTGSIQIVQENRITIKDGYKYFVNVGSAGQPRDSNPDACVVVLDEETETIEYVRIPYDISMCQSKILSEGLPSYLAERLMLAR